MQTTVQKAFRVLEALVNADKPRSLGNLAREMDLSRSNTFRLLETLIALHYARKNPATKTYEPTLKIWELGTRLIENVDLKKAGAEHLSTLATHTRETVHLSILDDDEVVYIDKIDSDQPVGAYTRIGGRAPAYCVATGKALLAYAPGDVVDKVIATAERFTKNTIVDPSAIKRELDAIRRKGVAVNMSEWRDAVCGLAAPLRDSSGTVVAAVGISGPAERLTHQAMKTLEPMLLSSAESISRALGYLGSSGLSS